MVTSLNVIELSQYLPKDATIQWHRPMTFGEVQSFLAVMDDWEGRKIIVPEALQETMNEHVYSQDWCSECGCDTVHFKDVCCQKHHWVTSGKEG